MLSDIEIAQGCQMRPITEVAAAAGLDADDLELYGKYKAKLSADVWTKVKDKENGKLVLVTAINPTPAGEGKTTTSVGLGQALCKQGKNAIIALREPSLGPVFGIKGGAAGGPLRAGRADGGHQPALYRRYARHHSGKQPAVRHAGQSHAAGQSAEH